MEPSGFGVLYKNVGSHVGYTKWVWNLLKCVKWHRKLVSWPVAGRDLHCPGFSKRFSNLWSLTSIECIAGKIVTTVSWKKIHFLLTEHFELQLNDGTRNAQTCKWHVPTSFEIFASRYCSTCFNFSHVTSTAKAQSDRLFIVTLTKFLACLNLAGNEWDIIRSYFRSLTSYTHIL